MSSVDARFFQESVRKFLTTGKSNTSFIYIKKDLVEVYTEKPHEFVEDTTTDKAYGVDMIFDYMVDGQKQKTLKITHKTTVRSSNSIEPAIMFLIKQITGNPNVHFYDNRYLRLENDVFLFKLSDNNFIFN